MKSRKNMNQGMARLLMALVIAFGVETTANAQLGGLLKKAKQTVKEKVTNNDVGESSSSTSTATPTNTSEAIQGYSIEDTKQLSLF